MGAQAPAGVDAKALYRSGVQQYKSGDWIAARENFELAIRGGYKPGMFEDSPQDYLRRMDRKEQAEMERLVNEKTEALRLANERLERLSFVDSLTGLANRLLTGDSTAAGALVKLEMHHPYLTRSEVIDATPHVETIVRMLACHASQYTEAERQPINAMLTHGFDGRVHLRPWNGSTPSAWTCLPWERARST